MVGEPGTKEHEITHCEWSVARILSYTTPRDVCRLGLVNRVFKAASDSDLVWDRMLPPGISTIIEQADGGPIRFASKKELYLHLCKSILLNSGNERYWLDRPTGEQCYMLSARALTIDWGNDLRYWDWIPFHGSWFHDVAHLRAVCWLKIQGRLEKVLQMGTYTASFRIHLDPSCYGWRNIPIEFSISSSAGNHEETIHYFDQFFAGSRMPRLSETSPNSTISQDDWVEYDVGEIRVGDSGDDVELQVSMAETRILCWKGGLSIDGVIIRPSYVVRRLAFTSTLARPPLNSDDPL